MNGVTWLQPLNLICNGRHCLFSTPHVHDSHENRQIIITYNNYIHFLWGRERRLLYHIFFILDFGFWNFPTCCPISFAAADYLCS